MLAHDGGGVRRSRPAQAGSGGLALCLAKTLRVRRISDFEANLRCALFDMIP